MPSGRSASRSLGITWTMASCVPPQRSQVSPSGVTSRCQRICRVFMSIGILVELTPVGTTGRPGDVQWRNSDAGAFGVSSVR